MGPEAGSDVFEIAVAVVAVEALVGGGLLQGAQVLDRWLVVGFFKGPKCLM